MDAQFWLNVVTRWIHVASAVVGVGALVFVWLVVMPAERTPASEGSDPAGRMLPGLKRLFHIAMGLLLLSGFYNFFTVIPKVSGLGEVKSIYHAVIGIKILLAVVLFGIVSATLASLAEAPEPPARLSRWLGPIVLLAAVILLLSAFLRRTWYLDPRLATPPAITAPVPIEPQ